MIHLGYIHQKLSQYITKHAHIHVYGIIIYNTKDIEQPYVLQHMNG